MNEVTFKTNIVGTNERNNNVETAYSFMRRSFPSLVLREPETVNNVPADRSLVCS